MTALMIVMEADAPAMALDIPPEQTFEEWVAMGRQLAAGSKVVNWWIGDWWAHGDHRHGARAKAAAEGIFGREFQTMRNIASVCRSFETSRRRDDLSFGHHAEVAALPPEKADAILSRAEREDLSVRDVRREVTAWKVETGLLQPKEPSGDADDDGFIAIGQEWNSAPVASRLLVLQSVEEMGAISIVDTGRIGDIPL